MDKKINTNYDFAGNKIKNAIVDDPVTDGQVANKGFVFASIGNTSYTHIQAVPDTVWTIAHNLNKPYPSVFVKDSADTTIIGFNLTPIDNNNCTITFAASFGGHAYLS